MTVHNVSLELIEHFRLDARDQGNCIVINAPDRQQRGRKVQEKWRLEDTLGYGSYGFVCLYRKSGTRDVRAVKKIERSKLQQEAFQRTYARELDALARLTKHSDHFAEFFGWFEGSNAVFLSMEYFALKDLKNCVDAPVEELEVRLINRQLLQGLQILHDNKITHRDLKPENIFVAQQSPTWWVKIGDFGISKRIASESTRLETFVGTKMFMAPEVLIRASNEDFDGYSSAVDLWGLGYVLYFLLTYSFPFSKVAEVIQYAQGELGFPLEPLTHQSVSENGIEYIKKLMSVNANDRPSARAASEIPWAEFGVENGSTCLTASEASTPVPPSKSLDVASIGMEGICPKHSPKLMLSDGRDMSTLGENPMTPVSPEQSLVIDRQTHSGVSSRNESPQGHADASTGHIAGQANNTSPTPQAPDPELIAEDPCALTKPDPKANQILLWQSVTEGDEEGVKRSILHGADIEARELGIWQPLYTALRYKRMSVVRLLLDFGADVNAEGGAGVTGDLMLHYTAREGLQTGARLLLDYGADIYRKNNYGSTSLHCAAVEGHNSIVQMLLEKGARINAKNNRGWTPLHSATWNSHDDTVRLLLGKGALFDIADESGNTPLQLARQMGNQVIVNLLLTKNAKLNFNDHEGELLLCKAAQAGDEPMIERLLGSGVNVNSIDHRRRTVLHNAVGNSAIYQVPGRRVKHVQVLLDGGASIESTDSSGSTPLHVAAYEGWKEAIRLLLDRGANLEARDDQQRTPLHLASIMYRKDVVEYLIARGADVWAKDRDGHTPVSLAGLNKHQIPLPITEGASDAKNSPTPQ